MRQLQEMLETSWDQAKKFETERILVVKEIYGQIVESNKA
jgi:hypothetical protein